MTLREYFKVQIIPNLHLYNHRYIIEMHCYSNINDNIETCTFILVEDTLIDTELGYNYLDYENTDWSGSHGKFLNQFSIDTIRKLKLNEFLNNE